MQVFAVLRGTTACCPSTSKLVNVSASAYAAMPLVPNSMNCLRFNMASIIEQKVELVQQCPLKIFSPFGAAFAAPGGRGLPLCRSGLARQRLHEQPIE